MERTRFTEDYWEKYKYKEDLEDTLIKESIKAGMRIDKKGGKKQKNRYPNKYR